MKITAQGGTDSANVVMFWPGNLPEDADSILAQDPIGLAERLRDEGKLIWFLCDGDGDYLVAIFHRSAIPEDLLQYCRDEECIPALDVCGVGYFGGMEYMFKRDRKLLDRYPGMCEEVVIPNGTYSARIYRTDVPESVYLAWMESHTGASAKRLWDMHAKIIPCAVIGVLATMFAFIWVPWAVWFSIAAVAAALMFVAIAISRTDSYKSVERARDAFAKSYPEFVVQLM